MKSHHRSLPAPCLAFALATLILAPAVGKAQAPAEAPAAPAQQTLHPPVLVDGVEPDYPAEALAEGIEGVVVLRLTLDAEGQVVDAEVVESVDPRLDEAALEAGRALVFEPARRGDTPMAARIHYDFEFRLPPPPEEPGEAIAEGPADEEELEVVVQDTAPAVQLRRSARAVQVIETTTARREAADLGEVLAREKGISVRRGGGLGSRSEFGLNGLTGQRVRFFLDGVPLDLAGYPFGLANVPVNLIDRVDVYRGVVPIALGADALGGAVDLRSSPLTAGSGGSLSYQVGSFGTHRLTAGLRHLDEDTGLFARVDGFFDRADNDYEADVEDWDETGRTFAARLPLRNSDVTAWGIGAEAGLAGTRFADKLSLRAFTTSRERGLPHNQPMTVPYSHARTARQSVGSHLTYEGELSTSLHLRAIGGWAYNRNELDDSANCNFNWSGVCHSVPVNRQGGELNSSFPYDQHIDQHSLFARTELSWEIGASDELRLAVAPTYTTRTGRNEAVSEGNDRLRGDRSMLTLVSGVEWERTLFGGDVENILFAKSYLHEVRAEELFSSSIEGVRERSSHRFGVGDSLRWRLDRALFAKASYELATRLPNVDELFGNGDLIEANLLLEPEESHNLNLGLMLEPTRTLLGALRFDVNGFARFTDGLIILAMKQDQNFAQYQNVMSARSIGLEAAVGLTLPGEWLDLSANATWQDFRNTSTGGDYATYEGARIINAPWLFANFQARTRFEEVIAQDDEFSLAWITRWVNEFHIGWDGIVGPGGERQTVPNQLLHTLHAGYSRELDDRRATLGFEIDNLTDRNNYDYFGVQRPGRAYYAKLTLDL